MAHDQFRETAERMKNHHTHPDVALVATAILDALDDNRTTDAKMWVSHLAKRPYLSGDPQ